MAPPKTQSQSAEILNTPETWEKARTYVKEVGPFASSFTATIRSLLKNQAENKSANANAKNLSNANSFFVKRFLNAPSVRAPFYFIGQSYHANSFRGKTRITAQDLIAPYEPAELATILGLIYLYKRLRQKCDAELWERLAKHIHENLDIAGRLGGILKGVGFGEALLLVGFRYLAWGTFLKKGPTEFKNYRRDLKLKNKTSDQIIETQVFGCSHAQVATLLIQTMGYGTKLAESLHRALSTPLQKHLDSEAARMRVLLLWEESLYVGHALPSVEGEDKFSISEDDFDLLMQEIALIRDEGSQHPWLSMGGKDIGPEKTPTLAMEDKEEDEKKAPAKGASAAPAADDDPFVIPYEEIPIELRAHFSREEFSELSKEIQTLLQGG